MVALQGKDGRIITDRDRIVSSVEEFYQDLYSSKTIVKAPNLDNIKNTSIPPIDVDEVESALKEMKKGKAPGDDEIVTEVLKLGGEIIKSTLAELFSQCLQEGKVPDNWCNAVIILLHKKGSITDLGNYRPISLLSNIYKLFTKILTNRLTCTLDFNQPRE